MKHAFFLILVLLSGLLHGGVAEDDIAENYEAGPHLFYDCDEGHWACVSEAFYRECEKKWGEDLNSPRVRARCAPVGVMPTRKACEQRQLFLTGQNYGTGLCTLPGWKDKDILIEGRR